MKTLKSAIIAAVLTLGVNMAKAQVHIGVSLGYPARPVYYAPAPVYYQPAPVVYRPAYPVYYRNYHHGYYYRRPVMYHRFYRHW